MDRILEYLRRPLITAALGFVLGLIIGLPVLGWGLFPVEWKDATPAYLRGDLKQDYLRMAIDSYARNQDRQQALKRWNDLGAEANQIFATLQYDPKLEPQDVEAFRAAVQASGGSSDTTQPGQQLPATSEKPAGGSGINPVVLLVVFCLLTIIIGGALVYVLLLRRRKGGAAAPFSPVRQAQEYSRQVERTDFIAEGHEPPIAQFMTTYMLGDDLYDDSFSIDSPAGEFLGECGVGISETIGVGDPKKVTAFEVWLFDKNDIQTITKVLMSDHGFDDPNIKQRLLSKGEPVLVEPGKRILLETATLQLEARVVDMNYGQGALPPRSFFERLTLELAVWPKMIA